MMAGASYSCSRQSPCGRHPRLWVVLAAVSLLLGALILLSPLAFIVLIPGCVLLLGTPPFLAALYLWLALSYCLEALAGAAGRRIAFIAVATAAATLCTFEVWFRAFGDIAVGTLPLDLSVLLLLTALWIGCVERKDRGTWVANYILQIVLLGIVLIAAWML